MQKSPEIIHYKRLNKEPMSADTHTGAQSFKEAAEECGVADGEVLPPVSTTAGVEAAPVAVLVVPADTEDDKAATDPVWGTSEEMYVRIYLTSQ
jgi:hypothetical protein